MIAAFSMTKSRQWPETVNFESQPNGPQEMRAALLQTFARQDLKSQAIKSVTRFCKERPIVLKPFEKRFVRLCTILSDVCELEDTTTAIDGESRTKPPKEDVYADDIHKLFFDGIKRHTLCMPTYHKVAYSGTASEDYWHITRLCLNSGYLSDDQAPLFHIITATSEMSVAGPRCVTIPCVLISIYVHPPEQTVRSVIYHLRLVFPSCNVVYNIDRILLYISEVIINFNSVQLTTFRILTESQSVANGQSGEDIFQKLSGSTLLKRGDICKWLDNPTYAKVCLGMFQQLSYRFRHATIYYLQRKYKYLILRQI